MDIAVIGAGIAGLTIARALEDKANVHIYEKARGVSGRMSTRYADPYQFDHGAQYFTARSKAFKQFLKPFIEDGLVQEWHPKVVTLEKGQKSYKREWFEPHYVAAPKMNDLCKALAENLDVRIGVEVASISGEYKQWELRSKTGDVLGTYDLVISAAPAPQTVTLMPANCSFIDEAAQAQMSACFSLLLGFKTPFKLSFDAATVKKSPIGWIAVNGHKPNRTHDYSLSIQTTNDWADAHTQMDRADVQRMLISEVSELIGHDASIAEHQALHRWLYAGVAKEAGQACFYDEAQGLAACGDWCIGGRIEAAFQSADALRKMLL